VILTTAFKVEPLLRSCPETGYALFAEEQRIRLKRNEIRRRGLHLHRRAVKHRLRQILKRHGSKTAIEETLTLPYRLTVSPLISFIQSGDPGLKWPAVKCFGAVVSRLADEDLESARRMVRLLMWSLNDESGGIGWGSAEAMGEILARCPVLAEEYVSILLSYARKDGNYLEHEPLQRGLLWGIARVAESQPDLIRPAALHLMAYLSSPDAGVRGLAARLMGLLRVPEARARLRDLAEDGAEIPGEFREEVGKHRVEDLASEALKSIPSP
jgi:hypothetical protein